MQGGGGAGGRPRERGTRDGMGGPIDALLVDSGGGKGGRREIVGEKGR